MIVRARVKRVEDLPDWAKCCEASIDCITAETDEFMVDLDNALDPLERTCYFCSAPYRSRAAYKIEDRYMWAEVELIDIDEGLMTTAERIGG